MSENNAGLSLKIIFHHLEKEDDIHFRMVYNCRIRAKKGEKGDLEKRKYENKEILPPGRYDPPAPVLCLCAFGLAGPIDSQPRNKDDQGGAGTIREDDLPGNGRGPTYPTGFRTLFDPRKCPGPRGGTRFSRPKRGEGQVGIGGWGAVLRKVQVL